MVSTYPERRLDQAMTLFLRRLLRLWHKDHGHCVKPARRRRNLLRHIDNLEVLIDESLQEGDCDGFIQWGRPSRIEVCPNPTDRSMIALLLHEAAHLLAICRWRDGGHGRRFKKCLRELVEVQHEEPDDGKMG